MVSTYSPPQLQPIAQVLLHAGVYQVDGKGVEVKDQEWRVSLGKGDFRKPGQHVQEH